MAGLAGVAAPRPVMRDEAWYLAPVNEANVVAEVLALHAKLQHDSSLWMLDGQCVRANNPDAWFPYYGDHGKNNSSTAKKVCVGCPVARKCFDYAMAHPKVRGIWAGTTERDRRAAQLRKEHHA